MNFIGIDLAWSTRNETGIACIHSEGVEVSIVHTIPEMVAFVNKYLPARVAIDAPLTVPNEEGTRPAERELNKDFRVFHAGAHPANRKRLSAWGDGIPRGEELVHELEKIGVSHSPQGTNSICFECYPHSASVVLFNLTRIIPYKIRPHRTYESRWEAFETYQTHLSTYVKSCEILSQEIKGTKGKVLKQFEDKLDAIMCAHIAQYAYQNPDLMRLYGNLAEGYIFTPALKKNEDDLA